MTLTNFDNRNTKSKRAAGADLAVQGALPSPLSLNELAQSPPYPGRSNIRMTPFGDFAAKDSLLGDGNEAA